MGMFDPLTCTRIKKLSLDATVRIGQSVSQDCQLELPERTIRQSYQLKILFKTISQ